MKQITIAGTTTDTTPDNKPAICVFGEENTGKTRFGCTAPHDEGMIGWLALDKNSKAGIDEFKKKNKLNHILVNKTPFVSHADAIKISILEKPEETKKIYTEIVSNIFKLAGEFAGHPGIESIVVDNVSQFYNWILMSHFGRRNQIESFMRGAPNQDMIDFINAMSAKNLVLVASTSDIYKDTGEVDSKGNKKQAPTGKHKPEGYGKIGAFVTATIELTAKRTKSPSFNDKYHVLVNTCKGNTLLEGQTLDEYSVHGEAINWDNVMTAIQA